MLTFKLYSKAEYMSKQSNIKKQANLRRIHTHERIQLNAQCPKTDKCNVSQSNSICAYNIYTYIYIENFTFSQEMNI
jgi:hypothetical protein